MLSLDTTHYSLKQWYDWFEQQNILICRDYSWTWDHDMNRVAIELTNPSLETFLRLKLKEHNG